MIRQLRNLGYQIELPNSQASQAQAQLFSTLINAGKVKSASNLGLH
jgi:hypothetical protein